MSASSVTRFIKAVKSDKDLLPGGIHGPGRRAIRRFCVLDLETQRSAQEVGGWHRADLMGVSCAVIYDSGRDAFLEFLEEDLPDLLGLLASFDLLVGFNIKRFDYRVLSAYTDLDLHALPTLDILEDVHAQLGYRLSLDHLAEVTLGARKSASGLQALKWWKEGRIREILDYCRQDVALTKDVFLHGYQNGHLLFRNKAQAVVRLPVTWSKGLDIVETSI